MYLIQTCVCGSSGPFVEGAVGDVVIRRCECGVIHQATKQTREEYERQYRGDYHAAVDRHPGCVPYRERYAHDRNVAGKRWARYRSVLHINDGALRNALDVGCSTGAFVDYLRLQHAIDAYGVDPDPSMARDHVYTGSVEDVPLGVQRYDLITFHDVLEHLVDPIASLRFAVRELLAPGGRVVVDVPDVSTPAGHHHYKLEHLWYLTASSLIRIAGAAGLSNAEIDYPIPGKVVLCARRIAKAQAAA